MNWTLLSFIFYRRKIHTREICELPQVSHGSDRRQSCDSSLVLTTKSELLKLENPVVCTICLIEEKYYIRSYYLKQIGQ